MAKEANEVRISKIKAELEKVDHSSSYIKEYCNKLEALPPLLPDDKALSNYSFPKSLPRPIEILDAWSMAHPFNPLADSEKNKLHVYEARFLRYELKALEAQNAAFQDIKKKKIAEHESHAGDPRNFSPIDHIWIGERLITQLNADSYLKGLKHLRVAINPENKPTQEIIQYGEKVLKQIESSPKLFHKELHALIKRIREKGAQCVRDYLDKISSLVPVSLISYDDRRRFESSFLEPFSPLHLLELAKIANITLDTEILDETYALEARILFHKFQRAKDAKDDKGQPDALKYQIQLSEVVAKVANKRKLGQEINDFFSDIPDLKDSKQYLSAAMKGNDPDILKKREKYLASFRPRPSSRNFFTFTAKLNKLIDNGHEICRSLQKKLRRNDVVELNVIETRLLGLGVLMKDLAQSPKLEGATAEALFEKIKAVEKSIQEAIKDSSVLSSIEDRQELRKFFQQCQVMRLEVLRAQVAVVVNTIPSKWWRDSSLSPTEEKRQGGSPQLDKLIESGNLDAIKELKLPKHVLNAPLGESRPIILAASLGHGHIVSYFLNQGVDVTAKDKEGLVAFQHADKRFWHSQDSYERGRFREVLYLLQSAKYKSYLEAFIQQIKDNEEGLEGLKLIYANLHGLIKIASKKDSNYYCEPETIEKMKALLGVLRDEIGEDVAAHLFVDTAPEEQEETELQVTPSSDAKGSHFSLTTQAENPRQSVSSEEHTPSSTSRRSSTSSFWSRLRSPSNASSGDERDAKQDASPRTSVNTSLVSVSSSKTPEKTSARRFLWFGGDKTSSNPSVKESSLNRSGPSGSVVSSALSKD